MLQFIHSADSQVNLLSLNIFLLSLYRQEKILGILKARNKVQNSIRKSQVSKCVFDICLYTHTHTHKSLERCTMNNEND